MIMLRKILTLTVPICAATLFIAPADVLAWGGGSWNRSGSSSYTGHRGNTYSHSSSGSASGHHYGGYGGYHGAYYGGYHGPYYGGGYYYGGGFDRRSFLAGYAAGVYKSKHSKSQ